MSTNWHCHSVKLESSHFGIHPNHSDVEWVDDEPKWKIELRWNRLHIDGWPIDYTTMLLQ